MGFASFVYSLPGALFMLHAGLLTDRFGARRLVAVSLVGVGIPILLIGLLALRGAPLPLLVGLGFVMGMFQTLGSPAFISIVNDLVPPKAVSSAVALTFLGFNVGRILGGVLSGILLVALGTDVLVAAPMAIVVAGILQVPAGDPCGSDPRQRAVARTTGREMVRPLVETAAYVGRNPTLAVIIVLSIAPGAVGLVYMFLLPVVVRDLGAGPGSIGLLYIGGGIGGLLAGLVAEPVMRTVGHGRRDVPRARDDRHRVDRDGLGRRRAAHRRGGRTDAGRLRDLCLVRVVARAGALARPTPRPRDLAVHAALLGIDAVRRARRRVRGGAVDLPHDLDAERGCDPDRGRGRVPRARARSRPCGSSATGHSVAGDLRGSGYVPEAAPVESR